MGYIRVPIETNPETLAQDIFAYIQTNAPDWTPNQGNLDVWIIRALVAKAAENRDLASDVPDSIFGWFGSSLMAIPPVDAASASGDTTWTLIDTLGHTIPSGTYVGIRNANGDLITFQTVLDVVVAPGDSVTASGEVIIQAVTPGIASNDLNAVPELIDVLDWVSSIALVSPTGGGVDAETNDDYLNRLSRKMQALSTVPILPPDFANAALDADPGVFRAVAIDLYNPLHNLLTANQASAETDASGWTNLSNAAVTSTSVTHDDGAKAVRLTSVAGGDMSAIDSTEIVVLPGQEYTALASARSAVSARSCKVGIRFIDASHGTISTNYGTPANDSTSAYVDYHYTAIAPANAAFAKVVIFVTATGGATEVHDFDKMSLRHGAGTDWVAGGTPETGNARTITVAAVDIAGNAVSGGIKTAISNWITARREVNFIVHVIDPNYTEVDVAASFKLLSGFDSATVEGVVAATISSYLNSANWALDPTISGTDSAMTWVDADVVYYNELITLVSNVAGVDRVTDLTCNVHGSAPARIDVILNGPAALTTVGTITATAV